MIRAAIFDALGLAMLLLATFVLLQVPNPPQPAEKFSHRVVVR